MAPLKVMSYNYHGFTKFKFAFLDKLFLHTDFLFLQENWLRNNNLSFLCNVSSDVSYYGFSAMSDNVVLDGRPHGGVAILRHNGLNRLVTPYKHFNTRCCAVKVDFGHYACVLICIYFPTDNFSNYAIEELSNVLDELEIFILTLDADCILIGGDLNTDFSTCSAQSKILYLPVVSVSISNLISPF